jgi:hypothetical protein
MHRAIAVLAVVALSLAASTGSARANSSPELQIIKSSIEGTSVVLVIENTTKALVTGRCLGRFNNGVTIQDDVESLVKVEPGVHEVTLDFPEKGSVEINAIQDGPDGFPPGIRPKPGIVIVGTITDDINPF